MKFTKMHGLGNDFVMVNGFVQPLPDDLGVVSKKLCDRHFGIGADGLIVMVPSNVADARMRVFNSDGSEPQMCGNGLRCAALFIRDEGICTGQEMDIETAAGVLHVCLNGDTVTADMGAPVFEPKRIPVDADSNRIVLERDGMPVPFFCVSMGNPHAVTFDCWPDDERFRRLGAMLEKHPVFPERANIEFARKTEYGFEVHVWERGDGETMACGTGASAVFAAARELGMADGAAEIRLKGGALHLELGENGHLLMTGPAETVFAGIVEI